MPEINLTTNIKVDDPKALVLELSELAAEVMGKKESLIQARYIYSEYQTFGGSFDPAFSLEIRDIYSSPEASEKCSKAFSEFLTAKLGVNNNRGFVICLNPGAEHIGFMGTTVANFLKK
ncbi:hypothetical protein ACEPAF_9908 [Sanghuangporus sanghuang]